MNNIAQNTRPTFNEQMAAELAPFVANILNCETPHDEGTLKSIAKALRYHHSDDGFQLGKEMEDLGYDVDVDTVDSLDMVSDEARSILKKHIQKWVFENKISLPVSEGKEVSLKRMINKKSTGIVVGFYEDTAQYKIRIEGQSDTGHYVVNCEDITAPNDERSVATVAASE